MTTSRAEALVSRSAPPGAAVLLGLWRVDYPLSVSNRALARRSLSGLRPATCPWSLDSGGFTYAITWRADLLRDLATSTPAQGDLFDLLQPGGHPTTRPRKGTQR